MKVIIILFFSFLFFTSLTHAQQRTAPEDLAGEEGERQIKEMEKQALEILERTDPQAYQRRLKLIERQGKISEIINSYNKEEISESSARSRLLPLVNEAVEEKIESIADRIERHEKQIEYLRNIQSNPLEYANKIIDRYLGKAPHEPEEDFF